MYWSVVSEKTFQSFRTRCNLLNLIILAGRVSEPPGAGLLELEPSLRAGSGSGGHTFTIYYFKNY